MQAVVHTTACNFLQLKTDEDISISDNTRANRC